jgi:hypothetical protein
MRRCRAVSLACLNSCILAFLFSSAPSAQEVALTDVLSRAGAYVVEFQKQLAGIVAEEHYVQQTSNRSMSSFRSTAQPPMARDLRSDLLLLKPEGLDRWIQFRDVFEVDGRSVRDRDERLMKLFLQPSSSTASQADNIIAESTRYNIGNLQRTVNVPVLALSVLDPMTQRRFQFSRTRDAKPKLTGAPKAEAFWTIEYEEVSARTMIRTTNGRDMPCRGRFWIEPETGRVLLSELTAEDTALRAAIDVAYQADPAIGLLVPSEMRERYDIRGDGSRVDGTATYGKFRRFQVKVDEKIAPVKEK